MSFIQWGGYNSRLCCRKLETRGLLLGMGLTSEAVAKQFNISRVDQDEFAFQSHNKALKAHKQKENLINKLFHYSRQTLSMKMVKKKPNHML
jgi:hypothetical protein